MIRFVNGPSVVEGREMNFIIIRLQHRDYVVVGGAKRDKFLNCCCCWWWCNIIYGIIKLSPAVAEFTIGKRIFIDLPFTATPKKPNARPSNQIGEA